MALSHKLYAAAAKHARTYTPWQQAVKSIERATGVSCAEIQGPSRKAHIVAARWQVIALLRARGWSLPKIGKELNRDHTTILYALRQIAAVEARPQ